MIATESTIVQSGALYKALQRHTGARSPVARLATKYPLVAANESSIAGNPLNKLRR